MELHFIYRCRCCHQPISCEHTFQISLWWRLRQVWIISLDICHTFQCREQIHSIFVCTNVTRCTTAGLLSNLSDSIPNVLLLMILNLYKKTYSLIIDGLLLHPKRPFWVNTQTLWNKQNLCHWLPSVCGLSALCLRACVESSDCSVLCTVVKALLRADWVSLPNLLSLCLCVRHAEAAGPAAFPLTRDSQWRPQRRKHSNTPSRMT